MGAALILPIVEGAVEAGTVIGEAIFGAEVVGAGEAVAGAGEVLGETVALSEEASAAATAVEDLTSSAANVFAEQSNQAAIESAFANATPAESEAVQSIFDDLLGTLDENVGSSVSEVSQETKGVLQTHLDNLIEEVTSGNFAKKKIQQLIVAQFSKGIKTGNPDADRILRGIANAITGGVAFAELDEGSRLITDALSQAGVKIPESLKLGDSASGAIFDIAKKGDVNHIVDTLQKVATNLPSGVSPIPIPTFSGDTKQVEEIKPVPSNNGRIDIISDRGNTAPVSEGVIIRTNNVTADVEDVAGNDQPKIITEPPKVESAKVPTDGILFYDANGDIIEVETSHFINPGELGQDIGKLVGYASNQFTKISKNADKSDSKLMHTLALKSFEIAGQRFPKGSYLAKTVYNFLSSSPEFNTPNTEEYLKIAGVFNGKCLAPNKMYYNSLGQVTCVDESGQVISYVGAKGSVPGYEEFCGPWSKNSKLPTKLLDVYCFLHDTDYDNLGYFSKIGDYKFISRISQNIWRMEYGEKVIAQLTLDYFVNIGLVLGALKTQFLPDDIDQVVFDTGLGGVHDIFSELVPEPEEEVYIASGLQKSTGARDKTRTDFYAGVRVGVDSVRKINEMSVTGESAGSSELLEQFMAITTVA